MQRRNSRFSGRALALFSAAFGLLLLFLAIPRILAAWASLEAQPAVSALQNGKQPAVAELLQGIAGLRRAVGWTASARRYTDLALLEVEQADRLPPAESADKHRLLASAEKNLVAGLAANPSNGFAWLRLALLREQLQAPPRAVVEAALQSVDMSPNMRKLWIPRTSLLLAYWRQLTPDEMPTLRAQLRTIWASHEAFRQQLVQAARQTGQTLLLLWAIGDDQTSVAEFQRLDRILPLPQGR